MPQRVPGFVRLSAGTAVLLLFQPWLALLRAQTVPPLGGQVGDGHRAPYWSLPYIHWCTVLLLPWSLTDEETEAQSGYMVCPGHRVELRPWSGLLSVSTDFSPTFSLSTKWRQKDQKDKRNSETRLSQELVEKKRGAKLPLIGTVCCIQIRWCNLRE